MSFSGFILLLLKTARDNVSKISTFAEKQILNVAQKGVDLVVDKIPFEIPIELDVEDIANGNPPDTSPLEDEETLKRIAEESNLTDEQKEDIENSVKEFEQTLSTSLEGIISLEDLLNNTKKTLQLLGTTGQILNTASTTINIAQTTIKTLPIPTGAPLGVGLPLNVITTLSDTLDTLKGISQKVAGGSQLIEDSSENIKVKIDEILELTVRLKDIIESFLDVIKFILTIVQSEEDIDKIDERFEGLLNDLGNSSSKEENASTNKNLLDRLQPNSNNPMEYKDFKLEIQFLNDDSSIPKKRIVATNKQFPSQKLATDYSFVTTPNVLINEIEFKIDNYNLVFVTNPILEELPEVPETINEDLVDPLDINVEVDEVNINEVIDEVSIDDLTPEERFTKKEIRKEKRKDRKKDREERRQQRKSGELTRKEARKDKKQDRKDRKKEARERRKNRKRKKEQ
jgi:hypothetical protein